VSPNLDFKVTKFVAVDVLCAQLTRDLFAIAKFLVKMLLFAGAPIYTSQAIECCNWQHLVMLLLC